VLEITASPTASDEQEDHPRPAPLPYGLNVLLKGQVEALAKHATELAKIAVVCDSSFMKAPRLLTTFWLEGAWEKRKEREEEAVVRPGGPFVRWSFRNL
jgi:hypothetical protein